VQAAQVYLRYRPLTEDRELRSVARDISRMPGSPAQVRALEALARLNIRDREVLSDLARAFAAARSVNVQRAIAEVFIRSDVEALPRPEIVSALREHRLRAPDSRGDLVDVLLQKLAAGS
jgi:hypothetical protein